MNLWDDPNIVREAAVSAIELYAHAVNGQKLEHEKAKAMFDKITHVLARCFIDAIAGSVKREAKEAKKESEEYIYDDPNM